MLPPPASRLFVEERIHKEFVPRSAWQKRRNNAELGTHSTLRPNRVHKYRRSNLTNLYYIGEGSEAGAKL